MKWQQRIRVLTGLGCWQIMLHILILTVLVAGWKHKALVEVGVGLCLLYGVTFLAVWGLQHYRRGWQRELGDTLEELTTSWYFGCALIALWLISRLVNNPVLMSIAGLALLAGPTLVSILTKERSSTHLAAKQHIRR